MPTIKLIEEKIQRGEKLTYQEQVIYFRRLGEEISEDRYRNLKKN